MSDKAEGKTIFSALTMASEEVQLVNDRTVAWTVAMDKSMVSIIIKKRPRVDSEVNGCVVKRPETFLSIEVCIQAHTPRMWR